MSIAIQIASVSRQFGAKVAVNNVSLNIPQGQCFGLIGPNGAGKSTLFGAIMGIVSVRSGDVMLRGKSIKGRRPEDIVRDRLALVPEGRQIFSDLSVQENLNLGLTGRRDKSGAKRALEHVHDIFPVLTTHSEHQAGMLSGGQQQQLAIARALVADPEVLLLDEPSLGLSPTVVKDVFERLIHIAQEGTEIGRAHV